MTCTDERMCSKCYSGQGICDSKVQEFLDGLNELSDKIGIYMVVDVEKQEMTLTEKDDDVYNLGWNLREDGVIFNKAE